MARGGNKSILYAENAFRYYVVPAIFLPFFTFIVQYLAIIGRGEQFTVAAALQYATGNAVSWNWVAVICTWAYLSLQVPSKIVLGPETPFGYRPEYKDNGWSYYLVTSAFFLLVNVFWPNVSTSLYSNFPQILGAFNILALILCAYIWMKGKYFPEFKNDRMEPKPIFYEFYRGLELHPKLLGVDIKQFTNCRVGLMAWQIFIFAFLIAGYQDHGYNPGELANIFIQTVYIGKFFWWEAGYFYTLDMMLDRAGYYLCWGCLVWVTGFYTYSSYYPVAHPPTLSAPTAYFILALGIGATLLNYRVDYEKQEFRSSLNYKCTLWGKPATYVIAEYTDHHGKPRKSALLTSGFWGMGRHMNYTFELLAAWSWCAATGLCNSFLPFLYFFFLFALLTHRIIRDEDKCSTKYGKFWQQYCKKVPYRLIPYVW